MAGEESVPVKPGTQHDAPQWWQPTLVRNSSWGNVLGPLTLAKPDLLDLPWN
jgi:hypothetical protein